MPDFRGIRVVCSLDDRLHGRLRAKCSQFQHDAICYMKTSAQKTLPDYFLRWVWLYFSLSLCVPRKVNYSIKLEIVDAVLEENVIRIDTLILLYLTITRLSRGEHW